MLYKFKIQPVFNSFHSDKSTNLQRNKAWKPRILFFNLDDER